MALGLTQPLAEMSTRNLFWGAKGGRCIELTTLPPSCADCHEIWEPQTPGTFWVCPGLYWDCFTFTQNENVVEKRTFYMEYLSMFPFFNKFQRDYILSTLQQQTCRALRTHIAESSLIDKNEMEMLLTFN